MGDVAWYAALVHTSHGCAHSSKAVTPVQPNRQFAARSTSQGSESCKGEILRVVVKF
jgi:hypothetical protein